MKAGSKMEEEAIAAAVKVGGHKSKRAAVNISAADYVKRRNRLRILELAGKIEFEPGWDYKEMRRGRS